MKKILFMLISTIFSLNCYAAITLIGPAGAVAVPGNDTEIIFNDAGSFGADSGFIFDKATGNVGIGTTTPGTLLQVNGLTTIGSGTPPNHVVLADAVFMNSTNIGIDKLSIFGSSAVVGLEKSPHIVIHNENQTTSNNGIIAWTSDNTTNNEVAYAAIVGITGSRAAGGVPGELAFHTRTDLATSLAERMRIDSIGNVGIGTVSPISLLHISEDSTTTAPVMSLERVDASVTTGNAIGSLSFLGGEDGTEEQVGSIIIQADEAWTASTSATRIIFSTTPSGATNDTERMRIDPLGNIFIKGGNVIYDTAVNGVLKTKDNGAGNSENLTISTGTATGTRGTLTLDALSTEITSFGTFELSDLFPEIFGPNLPMLICDGTTTDAINAFGCGFGFKGNGDQGLLMYFTQDITSGTVPSADMQFNTGFNAGTGNTGKMEFFTGRQTGASGNTGGVRFDIGNASNGNSGNFIVVIGTASGTRGKIRFSDGSQGIVGEYWRSTSTLGDGNWENLAGKKVTADPCGDTTNFPESTIFYNDTSKYYCFCNGTDDVQMHSPATACF